MVKGAAAIRKQKLHRSATARRRRLLRAMSGVAKSKAKPKAKARSRGPQKKSKLSELPAHGYESWAMLKPFDVFCALLDAGETERLCLDVLKYVYLWGDSYVPVNCSSEVWILGLAGLLGASLEGELGPAAWLTCQVFYKGGPKGT